MVPICDCKAGENRRLILYNCISGEVFEVTVSHKSYRCISQRHVQSNGKGQTKQHKNIFMNILLKGIFKYFRIQYKCLK